jgi:hypothetical protein
LAFATLQPLQEDDEPFFREYFGTPYSGLKALVSLVVHALRPIWEHGCRARLSAKPHANIICPAQGAVVAIFTLRGIGKPITMAAEEVRPGSVELCDPPTAGNSIDNARANEIGPSPAESARSPDNRSRLFDVLPLSTVPPDPIGQDQSIAVSPDLDPGDPLTVTLPFPAAPIAWPQTPRSVETIDIE